MIEIRDKKPNPGADEYNEALRVINNYRSNICGMGPFFDNFILNALKSAEKRTGIGNAATRFFNTSYFSNEGKNNFPHNSYEILGIHVYQGKCSGMEVELAGNDDTLLSRVNCEVNVELDNKFSNELNCDKKYLRKNGNGKNTIKISYNCAVETIFSKVEQFFLFMRAFWYYIEGEVARVVLHNIFSENLLKVFDRYISLRKSLIEPFIKIKFPETLYMTKIKKIHSKKVEKFYKKDFFSKLSRIQNKSAFMAGMIKNEANKILQG